MSYRNSGIYSDLKLSLGSPYTKLYADIVPTNKPTSTFISIVEKGLLHAILPQGL